MDAKIDQKKYLQKYLNPKKHKKKSRKNAENSTKRVNIIDDDIDVSQMMSIGDLEIDIYTTGEDAPQIAGIIDERPIDVRLKEKFKFNTQWKLINEDNGFNSQLIVKEQKRQIKNSSVGDESKTSEGGSQDYSPKCRKNYSGDEYISTHKSRLNNYKAKKSDKNSDSDCCLPRNKGRSLKTSKRDNSPPTKTENNKDRYHSDSDTSPPRKRQPINENSRKSFDNRLNQQSDSDTNPPRINSDKINKLKQDSDTSPPRKKGARHDSDASPPRKTSNEISTSKQDSDKSPPRKRHFKSEKGTRQDYGSDINPNRNTSRWDQPDSDGDPPRKHPLNSDRNKNNRSDSDTSPPRKYRQSDQNFDKSTHNFREPTSTGDRKFEKKKNQRYHSDSDTSPPRIKKEKAGSSSPKHVNVVKFNIRNPDHAEKKQETEKRQIQEEKYATWGKGLKQVEEHKEKKNNDSHEMSKPLARYANDEDLENFLKEQEREGDPMLEYIRKQNKTDKQDGKSSKPKYRGAFMPNRFGIPPGYRWDGVDRSNGYEANWFDVQNSKKVFEEEAYKWSTDDM